MARQQKGSANWKKTAAKVKAVHEKIRRTRKFFVHKTSTYLLRTYGTLAIEDLRCQTWSDARHQNPPRMVPAASFPTKPLPSPA